MSQLWQKPEWRVPASAKATVVCVHGAVVDGYEMGLLRHRLQQLGYKTPLFHYRSMVRGLEDNVHRLKEFLNKVEGDVLHVVGHSMGGVLTRHIFERMPDPRPGRIVALGSPLLDCWIGHRISGLHGKSYCLLGRTVHDHILSKRDPVWRGTRDFGVIAGTYPFGIGAIFQDLPRPSDGVVLLDETRLQGISDHVAYRLNHFGLLLSKRCTAQVARFLATGTFKHAVPSEEKIVSSTAETSVVALHKQRQSAIIYDDAYGVFTEADQTALSSQAWELMDGDRGASPAR